MKKILTIAEREFLMVVRQPAFAVTVVTLPLLFLLLGTVLSLVSSRAAAGQETKTVGLLDRAAVLPELPAADAAARAPSAALASTEKPADVRFVRYDALDAGLRDLHAGDLRALYVLEDDYLQTGVVKEYVRGAGLFSSGSDPGLPALRESLREALARRVAPGGDAQSEARLRRALAWTEVREMNVGSDGRLRPVASELVEAGRLMIPLITAFLLTSSIFVCSGYMLRAVVEEKSNRTIEILFSSVTPRQLLWGKIIGLSGAALLQMTIYAVLSALSVLSVGSALNVSPSSLALSLVYAAFGFLLYAGLLTGAGIVAGRAREGTQVAAVGGLLAISPLLFLASILNDPNGVIARALSYIPLTAPVTMVFRLTVADVPTVDRAGSLAVLATATLLAVLAAARLLRTSALLYGQRPGLFGVLKMLARG